MNIVSASRTSIDGRATIDELIDRLGLDPGSPARLASTLPFSRGDVTCGSENELQVAVLGSRENVDLPLTIETSNYFRNIIKRHQRGELPRHLVNDLEAWLEDNDGGVWDNSWIRLPLSSLSPGARRSLENDLKADKSDPASGRRKDANRFLVRHNGDDYLRAPVSYLLRLALIDSVSIQSSLPLSARQAGMKFADHYICDNTSPETCSFHVSNMDMEEGGGRSAAEEMSRRFLLTQLLVAYAGKRFKLFESGQQVLVYFAPTPPSRQRELGNCITDTFYRELFMNPCLSGWDRGEDKHRYMHLCHEVMSRAQLNSLARLKEAGIITSNLVVLPSASNVSLANNGTHLSIGSRKLTTAFSGSHPVLSPDTEKYYGDLVIKFVEHFLPLFVNTYSAAPYRLDFKDFHPEKTLSFLPYQLDYTHLRMIWRRWRKKAKLKVQPFGFRLTPFGPQWLDRLLGRACRLKGDFLPDYRLLDYLVAVMSTDQCPALDGSIGSQERLKEDLAELGVFDPRMPVYMLYRQRMCAQMGFSGFEGRHYSLFESLDGDFAPAAELQVLVTALAWQFILTGRLTHDVIPDDPETESERRQVFFGTAIGLPTFFVRANTRNHFLRSILSDTKRIRPSRRYPGYLRVRIPDYRRALAGFLSREAPALIECLGLKETVEDLQWRLEFPESRSAMGKITRGVLDRLGVDDPFKVDAGEFNQGAECYYRDDLRSRMIKDAWTLIERDVSSLRTLPETDTRDAATASAQVLGGRDPLEFIKSIKDSACEEAASLDDVIRGIGLVLTCINFQKKRAETFQDRYSYEGEVYYGADESPVHRQANR